MVKNIQDGGSTRSDVLTLEEWGVLDELAERAWSYDRRRNRAPKPLGCEVRRMKPVGPMFGCRGLWCFRGCVEVSESEMS